MKECSKNCTFPSNSVHRRQTVEPQPKMPREQVARSVDKMTVLSVQKKKVEEGKEMSHPITMAKKLTEYSEGKCRADIALRPISPVLEGILYLNCKKCLGNPRPDRYASYLFRALVPYDIYCDWVAKVNYVGLLGKDALPKNLRRTMRTYIEHRFPLLSCANWREIRDVINEILRVKRRPNFFQKCNGQTFEGADV